MVLVYADGDEAWRREENTLLASMLSDYGNSATTVQVNNRNHMSIFNKAQSSSDPVVQVIFKLMLLQVGGQTEEKCTQR
jgi:hypothetical protein